MRRLPLTPLLAVPLVLVTLLAVGLGVAESNRADTTGDATGDAVETAKDYVNAVAVQQNGLYACRYLSGEQQDAVAARRDALDCRDAISDGAPFASGVPDTVHAVHSLPESAQRDGATVRVQLGEGDERLSFVLRRANEDERSASFSPNSSWRIERGAASVLAR